MSQLSTIPYGKQSIDDADIAAVVRVLKSDFITQGPAIASFERAMADYVGAKHAIAVSNATAALHLGALALGLKPGMRLWTSPNTFVASANCALYCAAEVDFVEIDPRTYNMSVSALRAKLMEAEKKGTLPHILVPVDFAGQSCEMVEIRALASQYGCRVMEDASHAVGAEYRGQKVGAGAHADLTVFSFHPVKILTTGEGGMLLTNDDELYQTLLRLRTHGITRDPRYLQQPADGPWSYQQIELGYNDRMTDIQAALGESQLSKLPAFLASRRAHAARYDALLVDVPQLTRPWQHPDTLSAWHLYVIQVPAEHRLRVYEGLKADGIFAQVHYIPVHTQPYYQQLGFQRGDYPLAESYYASALSLPMYASLTEAEQDRVIASLRRLLA
jgi:UDP-4-amino-4,6-dideoxy-N-acetyl-beta-L-altrosamine transaminase